MPLKRWDGKSRVRIELPTEGEWVEVKGMLSRSDEREIQRRMMSAAKTDARLNAIEGYDVGIAYDVAEFATLEQVFIKGRVHDERGTLVAMHAGMLRDLDDASLEHLRAELNALYPAPLDEDDAKNSTGDGPPSSEGGSHRRRSSNGSR